MAITMNQPAAITVYAHKLEELDGPSNEVRKQHLRDFRGLFPLV